jgi:hypothetical protein
MSAFNTGNAAKLLKPGLNIIWGEYKDHPVEHKDLFETQSSTKNYEEDQLMPGLGLAAIKAEGAPTTYQTTSQGLTSRYTHVAYSTGFMITREAIADNQYKAKALKAAKMLNKAFRHTKETVAANVYNRGHNSSYLGADGVVLFSTAHPTIAGSQSNRLTTAADFSEAALEDLLVQISNATDEVGLKAALQALSLHIPTALQFEAVRVLKSMGQNDSANNAVNALRSLGIFSEGAKINHWFDDSDAFFIRTNADQGLIHFEREAYDAGQDGDFDTDNLKYKAYERYSFGWTDFRGAYSNGGGA